MHAADLPDAVLPLELEGRDVAKVFRVQHAH